MDYTSVSKALETGADPAMLCSTCPWDRNCLVPPSMTQADIKRIREESDEQDRVAAEKAKAEGKEEKSFPMGSLLSLMMFSGKDQEARVCPVFALRLRSSQGRTIVDSIRTQMLSWDDEA